MDKPDHKYLILVASQDGDAPPEPRDLQRVRQLRDRIDAGILRDVSTVLAPRSLGSPKHHRFALADQLLEHDYVRRRRPEILHAGYIEGQLKQMPDTQRAVLVVVPASHMTGIASALIHRDTRQEASEIRLHATSRKIEPGTGILAVYNGKWADFTPERAQIVQLSCPLRVECIKAPPRENARTYGDVLAAALTIPVLVRRSRKAEA